MRGRSIIAAMKRLVLSVVGGVAIPFLYTAIVGPLSTYSTNQTLNHYLGYPVRWPVLILFQLSAIGFQFNEGIMLLAVIVGNVLLYTVVTYVVLLVFSKPKAPNRLPPRPV